MLNFEQREHVSEVLRAARHKTIRSHRRMTDMGRRPDQTVEHYEGVRAALRESIAFQDEIIKIVEDDESWPDE